MWRQTNVFTWTLMINQKSKKEAWQGMWSLTRRRSAIRVPHPGPSSTRLTLFGCPICSHRHMAQTPTIWSYISRTWEIILLDCKSSKMKATQIIMFFFLEIKAFFFRALLDWSAAFLSPPCFSLLPLFDYCILNWLYFSLSTPPVY